MKDRPVAGIAFLTATVIVCGGSFIIASKGGDIVHKQPPQHAPAPEVDVPRQEPSAASLPERAPPLPVPAREAVQPQQAPGQAQSGIYRCTVNGSVTYSDQACPNGRAVAVQPNSGFDPTPVHRARQQVPSASSSTGAATQVTPRIPEPGARIEQTRSARCAAIDAEIAWIDERARAGGTASYQDALRERRHRLVDEKFQLKC